jgi:hypothetical protein
VTRRSTKRRHRVLVTEREQAERLAAFRAASSARLQAARLYRLGAEVLGELSAQGRERWIRRLRVGTPSLERLSRLQDDDVRADARRMLDARGLVVAPDGSEWIDPPRLGPELPPNFPRFSRRFA